MNVGLTVPKGKRLPKSRLEPIVLRGFGGGWNVVDEDTNMDPKYAVGIRNFRRTPSGAIKLRFGYKWVADVAGVVTGDIVDIEYFTDRLVVVTSTGQMATVIPNGAITAIWNSAIAGALPGAPTGWGATTQVDFVPWKDQLVVHNGTDKPVIISKTYSVTYLQDLATGSNINVPIGKYGCIAANYHCVGGIPAAKTTVYISAKSTAGTFPGDPAPNDAISIDVGAYAPQGAPEIVGMAGYRHFLIVFFRGQSLIIKLGEYDDSATPKHTPDFIDEMPQFGLINHRCIATVENDLRFAGYDGVASAKRNLFSGNIDSKFLSALIEPAYRRDAAIAPTARPFAVHNPADHETYLFTGDINGTVYVYQANENLKYESWTKYEGLRFTCGCRSFLGRVFMANRVGDTTKIYQLGNPVFPNEQWSADRVDDRDGNWDNATNYGEGEVIHDPVMEPPKSFQCMITHTSNASGSFAQERDENPGMWQEWFGDPLLFYIELPWVDGKDPMKVKLNKFVSIGSMGTAPFTFMVHVDKTWDKNAPTDNPANSMDFVGQENLNVPFRQSEDPQLYGFGVRFKSVKIIIAGFTTEPLTIASIRFLFQRGRYRR